MLPDMQRFFSNKGELEGFCRRLPTLVCSRCGATGRFVRHGYIRGAISPGAYGIRGWRIFCDPDSPHGRGCGWGPGLWLSATLLRRCFTAEQLLLFILALCAAGSVRAAWHKSGIGLSMRTGYRLHKRLGLCQSILRTCLRSRAPPPKSKSASSSPLLQVLTHLQETFGKSRAVTAYQEALQKDFLALA
ncbi:MAG: hypothetical protein KAI66_26005 [Lentisphaeria bacterium]|nr:hypothetical protein [Lentisphaeria bacterium]